MNLLYVAEHEAPWGEAAENMRMQYVALIQQAASQGYEEEGRKAAHSIADLIYKRLCGIRPPKKKPFKVSDL